jgi:hypothetical protein
MPSAGSFAYMACFTILCQLLFEDRALPGSTSSSPDQPALILGTGDRPLKADFAYLLAYGARSSRSWPIVGLCVYVAFRSTGRRC